MDRTIHHINLPPGTTVFTGEQKIDKVEIYHLIYNVENLIETEYQSIGEIGTNREGINWYDIRGLHNTEVINAIGEYFGLHPLILEDVADIYQRPKFEEFEQGNFLVLKALSFDLANRQVKQEQIGIYFRKDMVISFKETQDDLFASVRKRLQSNKGRIRRKEGDYLAYALMDVVADHYFVVIDEIEDVIDDLEDKILEEPDAGIKQEIHYLKKEVLLIKKTIMPFREAIGRMIKLENPHISESNLVFLRDLLDHNNQILEMVETKRDLLNGLQDLYLSELSFKMNQIMKVLTIISAVFIPLTFLAGVYGMNFRYMPELDWPLAYPLLWGIMILVFLGQLWYFKKKDWI